MEIMSIKTIIIISAIVISISSIYIFFYLKKLTKPKIKEEKIVSNANNYSSADFHQEVGREPMPRDYSWIKWVLILAVILYLLYLNFKEQFGAIPWE